MNWGYSTDQTPILPGGALKAGVNSILGYLLVAGLAVAARALLEFWPAQTLRPFQAALLRWPVLLAILLAGLIGVLLEPYVGFTIPAGITNLRELLGLPLSLGVFAALGLILLDLIFHMPENINVPLPGVLPFYFIAAIATEIILHQLPILLFVGGVGRLLLRDRKQEPLLWISVLIVAGFEPVARVMSGLFSGYGFDFLIPLIVLIYASNLVQLLFYRRSGFIAMLAYRWGLYLVWFILWGPLRLRLML
jgi:hypothetical protein